MTILIDNLCDLTTEIRNIFDYYLKLDNYSHIDCIKTLTKTLNKYQGVDWVKYKITDVDNYYKIKIPLTTQYDNFDMYFIPI